MSGDGSGAPREWGRLVGVLAEVVDDAPFGCAVVDGGLRFRFVNQYLARLHQLPSGSHVGRAVREVFPDDGLSPVEPLVRKVLESGVAHRDRETRLRVAGLAREFLVDGLPLRGEGGDVLGVAVTVRDLARPRGVTAEAEQRLSQLRQLAAAGTWDIDTVTGEVSWSDEMHRLLGTDPSVGPDPNRVVHPDDLPVARFHWSELIQGRSCTTEMRLVRADDGVITVVVAGEPVFAADGRVVAVRGTALDVTELRAAQHAAARARVDREHLIRLQERLLPARLPEFPGLRVSVAYEPADGTAAIGGDFYDCFPVDGGRLGFSVGDVAGHNIESAAVMSQVRAAITAYALDDPAPGAVVRKVDRFVRNLPGNLLVSLVYGVYSPGELVFANAGHPPPIVVAPGKATLVEHRHGPILGAVADAEWPLAHLPLPVGTTFFGYTDGLIERRGTPLDDSLEALRGALATCPSTDGDTLVRTALRMLPPARHPDDVCVLAITRTA